MARTKKNTLLAYTSLYCEVCGQNPDLFPETKVCCRLLKKGGAHETATTQWKAQNCSGRTREMRFTSGTTYEWTNRTWCGFRCFCDKAQFAKPGSTAKTCAEHRVAFQKSAKRSKAAKHEEEEEEKTPATTALRKELAQTKAELKRTRDERDELQSENKRLRNASAVHYAAGVGQLSRAVSATGPSVEDMWGIDSLEFEWEQQGSDAGLSRASSGGGLSRFNSAQLLPATLVKGEPACGPEEEQPSPIMLLSRESSGFSIKEDWSSSWAVQLTVVSDPITATATRVTRSRTAAQ